MIGKGVVMPAGLIITVVLARVLTPRDVGVYFLALNIASVAAMVGGLGLDAASLQGVARKLARDGPGAAWSHTRIVVATAGVSLLILAVLYAVLAGPWLGDHVFHSATLAAASPLIAAWIVALAYQRILGETFRGMHDIRSAVVFGGKSRFGGVVAVVGTVLGLLGIWLAAGKTEFGTALLVTVAAAAAAGLAGGVHLSGQFPPARRSGAARPAVATLLAVGLPLMLNGLTQQATRFADVLIVGGFRSETETGIYGAAATLSLLITVPVSVVNEVVPPIIGELDVEGRKSRLQRILHMTASLAMVPALAVAAVYVVAGGSVLELVYGRTYSQGWAVLVWLGLAHLATVGVGSCGYVLIMTGDQKALMWCSLAGAVLAVVGGVLVVEPFGSVGVAAVAALAICTQQILKLVIARSRHGLWTHATPRGFLDGVRWLSGELRSGPDPGDDVSGG